MATCHRHTTISLLFFLKSEQYYQSVQVLCAVYMEKNLFSGDQDLFFRQMRVTNRKWHCFVLDYLVIIKTRNGQCYYEDVKLLLDCYH